MSRFYSTFKFFFWNFLPARLAKHQSDNIFVDLWKLQPIWKLNDLKYKVSYIWSKKSKFNKTTNKTHFNTKWQKKVQ